MKKAEIVELMMKNKERFSHITHHKKAPRKAPTAQPKKGIKFKVTKTAAQKKAEKEKEAKTLKEKAEKARTEAKATNFLADIEQKGKAARKQIKKTKKEIPDSIPVAKIEMLGITKAQANAMDPAELFAKLPIIPKDIVEKNLGLQLETKYNMLKFMKGFKLNEFKKKLQKAQTTNNTRKAYFKFRGNDMDRLVANINRKFDNSVPILNAISDLLDSEIKRLKPEDDKAKARAEAREAKKDITKPNITNIYGYNFRHEDMPYDSTEYVSNVLDSIAWSEGLPKSEEAQMNLFDKVSRMETTRIKRSIGAFIKGKKFKTAEEAYEAYKKKMNEDDNYYQELDLFI